MARTINIGVTQAIRDHVAVFFVCYLMGECCSFVSETSIVGEGGNALVSLAANVNF